MTENKPTTKLTLLRRGVRRLFLTRQMNSLLCVVYRPSLRAKSDADIIRDARREALGLPPAEEGDRSRGPRMATDEMVMERFKKRMRK